MVKYLPGVREDLARLFLPLDQLLPVHRRGNVLPNRIKVIYVDQFYSNTQKSTHRRTFGTFDTLRTLLMIKDTSLTMINILFIGIASFIALHNLMFSAVETR